MKLGLLTAPFPETPLDEVVEWTVDNGFTTIEIACWPASSGDTRRYAGTSHIDVDGISDARAREIAESVTGRGLEISGLGYYPNPLSPDAEHQRMVIDHLKKVIVAAGIIMGVVFWAFVLGDDRTVKAFGVGLGVAILVDALIVRMTLVPAVMHLLGDKAWYMPRWLDRILPNLTIESPHEGEGRVERDAKLPVEVAGKA